MSNAQLGRDVVSIIDKLQGKNPLLVSTHYVNKTDKYISVKLDVKHLTTEQLTEATVQLHQLHPNRFLTIRNGVTHVTSPMSLLSDVQQSLTYDKVIVRFTQQ